jgi:hypothetical protein
VAHRLWQFQLFFQQECLRNEFSLLESLIGLIDSLNCWAKAIQHFLYLVVR